MRARLPTAFAAILTASMLASCATSTAVPSDTYCQIAGPIYFSDLDTLETIEQIMEHNAAYECACKQNCP